MTESKTELQRAFEGRERKLSILSGHEFTGPGEKIVCEIAVRVPTKGEENRARAGAKAQLKKLKVEDEDSGLGEELKVDAATVHILHASCRDPKNPKFVHAFPSPSWMEEHLTNDELHVLLNHVNDHTAKCSPIQTALEDETVEAYITNLAAMADSDIADVMLARLPREWLIQYAILVSEKLHKLRNPSEDRGAAMAEQIAEESGLNG